MDPLFLLSPLQMSRISPHFPLSHRVPRVDDRRVVSGIVYVIRDGLQWKDAPRDCGAHETLYHRFVRWSLLGVGKIFATRLLRGQSAAPPGTAGPPDVSFAEPAGALVPPGSADHLWPRTALA